jgi:hypothetical protein
MLTRCVNLLQVLYVGYGRFDGIVGKGEAGGIVESDRSGEFV